MSVELEDYEWVAVGRVRERRALLRYVTRCLEDAEYESERGNPSAYREQFVEVIEHLGGKAPAPRHAAEDDGWIPWSGGECPVPCNTLVDCRMRGGGEVGGFHAGSWVWQHMGHGGDVIAYRVITGADNGN